jgi:hypothetical protein
MGYEWVAGLVVLLGVVVLMIGGLMLSRPGWIMGWRRGTSGLALVGASAGFALFAVNIFNYQVHNPELPLATVSITEDSPQHFRVLLTDSKGNEQNRDVEGDLWQINLRTIQWGGLPSAIGFKTGYRLEDLRGRFLALEQETASDRKIHVLSEPDIVIDTWRWLRYIGRVLSWVHPEQYTTRFTPLADGATFGIMLTSTGVIIRPINERAETALKEWR